MTVDTSLQAVVDGGGALVLGLVGAGIVALGWRVPKARLAGMAAVSYGVAGTAFNFLPPDAANPWTTIPTIVACIVAAVLAISLAWVLKPARPWSAWVLGGLVALEAVLVVIAFEWPAPPDLAGATLAAFRGMARSLTILWAGAALAFRFSAPGAQGERRGLLFLAFGFTTYAIVTTVAGALNPHTNGTPFLWVHLVVLGGVLLLYFPSGDLPEPTLARTALLAVVALGLVGCALAIAENGRGVDFGVYGVMRSVGAVCLGIAFFRYEFGGAKVGTRLKTSATSATVSLAVLFITAQIAQNYLAAQYGLLLGGILAGVFLLVAQPIQRALERSPTRMQTADEAEAARSSSAQATYAAAVRLAVHDGAMTPEKELHLAAVADSLGIGHVQATRIRQEVARGFASAPTTADRA